MRGAVDFEKAPLLLVWEVTRACELACRHCRAEVISDRHPNELSLDEGRDLLDKLAGMGTPQVIFTGGDPLLRGDLGELVRHAKSRGLRTVAMLAATDRLTRQEIRALKNAALDQIALSLDGSTQSAHDNFRRLAGSFVRTMEGAAWAQFEKLPLQLNTAFGSWNHHDFEAIADLVEALGAVFWEICFLVPTQGDAELKPCTPEQSEMLYEKIFKFSMHSRLHIKVTEAPAYRRFVLEHANWLGEQVPRNNNGNAILPHELSAGLRAYIGGGVNSGNGVCFLDHVGNVLPSDLIPLSAGNIRYYELESIYRRAPLFRQLREADRLQGKCRICPYRKVCGGSRAYAYALTGDYLAEDPNCSFQPAVASV